MAFREVDVDGTKVTILTEDDHYTLQWESTAGGFSIDSGTRFKFLFDGKQLPEDLCPIDDQDTSEWEVVISMGEDTVSGTVRSAGPYREDGAMLKIEID